MKTPKITEDQFWKLMRYCDTMDDYRKLWQRELHDRKFQEKNPESHYYLISSFYASFNNSVNLIESICDFVEPEELNFERVKLLHKIYKQCIRRGFWRWSLQDIFSKLD